MKRLVINTFLSTALFAGSMSVLANCDKLQCEGVTNTVVSSMKASSAGTFLTFPLGTDAAVDCALIDGNSAVLETSHPQYSSIHSLLLTAVASNLSVSIEFAANTASCTISSVALNVAA
jgi:hypothetical protein